MGDKVIKTIHEKSILNGINGEKAPLSWLKKTLPSRMIILMLLGDQLNSNKSQNPTSLEKQLATMPTIYGAQYCPPIGT